MNKRIYLSPPHMSSYEQQFVLETFASNWIAPLGPQVDEFERELAEYAGTRGAAALSSGTAAIHLALRLLGVGPGDTVFCSSLTFIASASPILYQGAEPVFIDSEPGSWNMSPSALERAFLAAEKAGKPPRAAIVVNLYGQSADMDPLLAVCDRFGAPVIEDAAESLGATYRGRVSGTIGKFGIYSFNGNKIITTAGGGALVSNDLEALERARFLASQARDPARHYQHSEIGYNYRLSNVLAAIGRGQLKVLEERVSRRRAVFERYFEALSGIDGIDFMPEASYGRPTRWLTVLTVDPGRCGVSAGQIVDFLAVCEIEARPVWKPLHLQPVFSRNLYFPHSEENSVSELLFQRGLCLPSGSVMQEKDVSRVTDCVKKLLGRCS
ncbi:MAG: DegT/DnrJ/EryC1/StrS family aminotransferase [Eubacteriales bacterium]